MKLSERLALIRAGYKKKDIEALEAEEATEAEETTEAEEATETIDYKTLYEEAQRKLTNLQKERVKQDISSGDDSSTLEKLKNIFKES